MRMVSLLIVLGFLVKWLMPYGLDCGQLLIPEVNFVHRSC